MTARATLPNIAPRPPGIQRGHDATTEHRSPEESVYLLRSELDACRTEIERLRKAERTAFCALQLACTDAFSDPTGAAENYLSDAANAVDRRRYLTEGEAP